MHPIFASILLLLAGLAFIFVELLIPSAGLIAIVSGTLLVSGIVVGFSAGPTAGFIILGGTLLTLPITIAFLLKIWPETPIGRRLFISPPKAEDVEPDKERTVSLLSLIGKEGISRSKLLPAGSVTIDGRHYDAVSDGLPIEMNQKIKVSAIKAQRIFVRPVMRELEEDPNDALSQSIESLGLDEIDEPLR